jgi:Ca2+-binding RTX toxin-like protein
LSLVALEDRTLPSVTLTPPALQSANQNVLTPLNLGSFTDSGGNIAPFTVTINWGDNSPIDTFSVSNTGSLGTRQHTYAAKGLFTVSETVTDNKKSSDTKTFQVVAGTLVINTNDSGPGTLRQALLYSNASPGVLDTVTFNIPTSDPGYHSGLPSFFTIQPMSALLPITDAVIIDGYSQPGAVPAADNTPATILINVSGASAGTGAVGLTISGGGSTVKGLAINRFGGDGIDLTIGDGNRIQGNFIGTTTTGTAAAANGGSGVFITTANNTVGGPTAADRNVIAANAGGGIAISGGAGNDVISGNNVGVASDGTTLLPNGTGLDVSVAAANGPITFDGGTLTAGTGGVSVTATSIQVNSRLSTTSAAVGLTAVTTITEAGGGAITAGTLTTSSAGGTTLSGGNTVASFNAANTTSGDISLTNTASPLTITGVNLAGGGNLSVTNTGAIVVSGVISVAGIVTLDLGALGPATEGATGSITCSQLLLKGTGAGGSFTLNSATNDVATIAAATTAAVNYRDANDVTVGTVGTTSGITTSGAVTLTSGGSLTVGQPIAAGAVAFTAQNAVAVNASLDAGAGTIAIVANQGFSQGPLGGIKTTNNTATATASAVSITAGSGNAVLRFITAGLTGGRIAVSASGSIIDGDSDSVGPPSINLTAAQAVLTAGATGGIASQANVLETNIGRIDAQAGTGGVSLTNIGGLTIGQISSGGRVTIYAGGSILDGNNGANNITAPELVLVAGFGQNQATDPSGIGTAADKLETQVSKIEALAPLGGIHIANTGSVTVGGLGVLTPAISSTGPVDLNFGGAGNDLFNLSALVTAGSGTGKGGGFEDAPAASNTVIHLSDSNGFNQLDFSGATSGIKLDLGQTGVSQSFDGNGDQIIVSGNFHKLVGSDFADEFDVPAPVIQEGNNPNDLFSLHSIIGSTLYDKYQNTIQGFTAGDQLMDATDLVILMTQFTADPTISGNQLADLTNGFRTTISTGKGNDRVSAGLLTSVDLGNGDNQFTDTVDSKQVSALLNGTIAAGGDLSRLLEVLVQLRTIVKAGDGNDSTSGNVMTSYSLGGGDNSYENTADASQNDPLASLTANWVGQSLDPNLLGGALGDAAERFGETLSSGDQVNALLDVVTNFADATPDAMPDLMAAFAKGLSKNPNALGHDLGFLAGDENTTLFDALAAFTADGVPALPIGSIDGAIEGFVATMGLDPASASALDVQVESYAGNPSTNPYTVGVYLAGLLGTAPYAGVNVDQLLGLGALGGGFNSNGKLDSTRFGQLLAGFAETASSPDIVTALGDIPTGYGVGDTTQLTLLSEGFANGLSNNPNAMGLVLGSFAADDSPVMPEIYAAFTADGVPALPIGSIDGAIEGFVATMGLDPASASALDVQVESYAGNPSTNPYAVGVYLAGLLGTAPYAGVNVDQLLGLGALGGGFNTNGKLDAKRFGQLLAGFAESASSPENINPLAGAAEAFGEAEPTQLTNVTEGFANGLSNNPNAMGLVLGSFAADDSPVMPEIYAAFTADSVPAQSGTALAEEVGSFVSTMNLAPTTASLLTSTLQSYASNPSTTDPYAVGVYLAGLLGTAPYAGVNVDQLLGLGALGGGFNTNGKFDAKRFGQLLAGWAASVTSTDFVDPMADLTANFIEPEANALTQVTEGFALGAARAPLSGDRLASLVIGIVVTADQPQAVAALGHLAKSLAAAQWTSLLTSLGFTGTPPSQTLTSEGDLGTFLYNQARTTAGANLRLLLAALHSTVRTGSGNDVVGGGLFTSFYTGAGDDHLFVGPTDVTGLANTLAAALQAKGLATAPIGTIVNRLLDEAGGTFVGGKGNDTYYFVGPNLGHVHIREAPELDNTGKNKAVNTLDFSGFTGGAITLDLGRSNEQTVASSGGKTTLWLTLSNGDGIVNVIGTPGSDTIFGNDQNNTLLGAQLLVPPAGTPVPWNGQTQLVFLNFAGTSSVVPPGQQFNYSIDEENAIVQQLTTDYQPFHYQFTLTRPTTDSHGNPLSYTEILFNQTPKNGQPGGLSPKIDFADTNPNAHSPIVNGVETDVFQDLVVDVNGFLGGPGEPVVDGNPLTSIRDNLVALSSTIAAHELGHTAAGLRHQDTDGPAGFGVHTPPGPNAYAPAYPGLAGALESAWHIMASPASTGTSLFDAIRNPFFAEREDVKLAFANAVPLGGPQPGTLRVPEIATAHGSIATAQQLTLLNLAVPNTLQKGYNFGKQFGVTAGVVVATLGTTGESDFYKITGTVGQSVNIEAMSRSILSARPGWSPVDTVVTVYDSNGNQIAHNDDQFEPTDSAIFDLKLPADGTYFIKVNAFSPTNTGNYELFVYTFAAGTTTDGSNLLDGGGGNDVLIGGPSNDTLRGGTGNDTITGGGGNDVIDGGPGTNRLLEKADADFTLTESSLTGIGTDTLTSIQQATLIGGPSANNITAASFSGDVILQGLDGNDTLRGAKGHSILIGGAGNDTLNSGSGGGILIGGTGTDRLVGAAGNDIVIAGSTSLDYNPRNPTDFTGLLAIQAEWNSSHSITDRMNNILGMPGAGALNIGYYFIPNGPNRTVFDDTSIDKLTGSSGQNWFFVDTVGPFADTITDFGTGDFKTSIN